MSADGSTLEGETVGRVVDAVRKRELLLEIAASVPASKEEIVAVGDGANDLLMLGAAGLGVAFNAKPRVQEQAQARINQPSLINVLYLLGLTSDEIDRLVAE
ncbi:hypothetical protein HK405_001963 [Cladochytrium tenue]|nr:hypothetical protein HK405_001963 [Cladochytrium tenue]